MKTIVTSKNFDYLWEELSKELDIKKANVKIDRFDDAWPNIKIAKEDVENKVACVLLDFSHPEDFFINYALLQGLIDYKVQALKIIMPYFPVWTMERKWKPWEVATAHSFARILSTLPTWKSWIKNDLHIFDIHAEVEEYLFDSKNINVELSSMFPYLQSEIEAKSMVYPDQWAAKRFSSYFENIPKVICNKKRVDDKRIVEIMQWQVDGRDLVIMDDLIQSWWTIIETANLMINKWAKSVNAYATHWVFPNNSHKLLAKSVDKLIVTDSIPENIQRANDTQNMEIISIKDHVKEIIG